MKWIYMIGIILCCGLGRVNSVDLSLCEKSLGMENFKLPDSAITASSSYEDQSVGPKSARIRQELYGGAWCPKQMITKESYEYLQVDLGQLTVITKVEVQGRFGNGQGQEFTEYFLLEYQREDDGEWVRFKNRKGIEHFKGNTNTYLTEMCEVDPPIVCKRIRFIPFSQKRRTVCMRVELYGCKWLSGVVAYSMPQGDRRGAEVDLFDFTYDGIFYENHLSNGMGQLIDGETGGDNFRSDKHNFGIKGYDWVGWKNDSMVRNKPVEIIFKFEQVRNFSFMTIHTNNHFSKDVRVFSKAVIYFSVGGKFYQKKPLIHTEYQDKWVEYARDVNVSLSNNIGRYIKVYLYFDDKWIMISEVDFSSKPANNYTVEVEPPTTKGPSTLPPVIPKQDFFDVPISYDKPSQPMEDIPPSKEAAPDDNIIAIIVGTLAALIAKNLNGKVLNGNVYNSVATDDVECDAHICNGDKSFSRDYAIPDVTKSALVVALPPQPPQPPLRGTPNPTQGQPILINSLDKPPTYDALYAAADVINVQVPNIPSLQGVSGNNVYAVPNAEILLTLEHSVTQFPRDNLQFIEVLGEGQFGEVHLCEALNVSEFINDDYFINRNSNRPVLVAVKMLRRNADDRARADFHKEIKIMSQLKDPNIVRVLGVCTREEPLCMIVEYMKYGDLNQFLLDHVPESPVALATNAKTLSYGCLIYMASQIASGMKYLESLNMVHRDLATRNCLVGTNYTIKISDFGMSRSLYSADYYRIEGRAVLPIRWMAWESILLGKFTTKSDVWSFAVTLWEVLTFAKDQPYDALTDEMVIENAGHYYRNDKQEVYLPHPPNCPKEIYDLMCECWNRSESARPTFREIHMFLQRKNMGYNPKDEKMNQLKVPIC
ncbi:DDR2 [Mytilus coruscus]|uniref:DDR2 n=1 Tax=Mytilus coruscus TaxID=42192 RepID=A0A6J8AAN2_MYTCO|nr:DDR2 [Mytilus coruscus]